ncbi:cysteine desulfurase family protein [Flavobacterium sp. TBRC 19031]|uniref:cysteine desulfurase family protein n=1 Tax=Flavobacterium mekongense TaxID=3379707 RepID=UPI00399C21C5
MELNKIIYLDHHATTPVDPRVLEVMLPYFTEVYGNAASIDHEYGFVAKQAVDKAREQIAKAFNAQPEEIIFTSGATESNNIAIFGVAEKYVDKGKHIITCVTEHKAVLDCCKKLETQGYLVTYLPVDQYGLVDLELLEKSITKETILISIMAANNEIGTIAPLQEIGAIAKKYGIIFHTDAAQAVGHIPIDVQKMNIDVLSVSGHKIYGPKGIGVLYRRKSNPRINLSPVIYGGGHEKGLRSGTLNVPAIVGIGKAIELALKEMRTDSSRYKELITLIYTTLKAEFPEIVLNGHPEQRLSHNLNISIPGVESKALIVQLKDIAISAGSACTTTSTEPSHVISALGFGEERAHNAIRISVGRKTTKDQIFTATDIILETIKKIRELV